MSKSSKDDQANTSLFRDCVFDVVVQKTSSGVKSKPKKVRQASKTLSSQGISDGASATASDPPPDPSELADFSDYLAAETFSALPQEVRGISFETLEDDVTLADKWSLPLSLDTIEEVVGLIPGTVHDSLEAYGLITPPQTDIQSFFAPVLAAYLHAATQRPPKWTDTKVSACEICDRDWVPMTYHHLIPRAVHAKVLKRSWHEENQLNSVAWLCRACHSFVHRMASNEELAKEWYTVDRICSREDVQKWAQWVQRIRWKKT